MEIYLTDDFIARLAVAHVRSNEFQKAWLELEAQGACDSIRSAEFRRLCVEWIKGSNFKDVREFIRHEANKPPQTGGE